MPETNEEKMTTKQLIKDYVDDHYEHFEWYPLDVEIDDRIYSWDEYWSILDDDRIK